MIGILTEYVPKTDKVHIPDEVNVYLNLVNTSRDIRLIRPDSIHSSTSVLAYNPKVGKAEQLDLSELSSLYFGSMGKNIKALNIENCFSENVNDFKRIANIVTDNQLGSICRNPVETMISNMSKKYLLELQSKGVDTLPSEEVSSWSDIEDLLSSSNQYLIKPLIGERAHGIVIVRSENYDALQSAWKKYGEDQKAYDGFPSQGIIAQPFTTAFQEHGERKIAVVDGEITFAKSMQADSELVVASHGAKVIKYQPTAEEKKLVENVHHIFSDLYPNWYMRVDLTDDPKNPKVNEVEAINPNYSCLRILNDNPNDDDVQNHVRKVLL